MKITVTPRQNKKHWSSINLSQDVFIYTGTVNIKFPISILHSLTTTKTLISSNAVQINPLDDFIYTGTDNVFPLVVPGHNVSLIIIPFFFLIIEI